MALGQRQRSYLVHFEHQRALGVRVKRWNEARAPRDLVIPVRISGVHRLAEGIVKAFDEDQDLGLEPLQILRRFPMQGTVLVNRVHNRSEERRVGKECRSMWWPDA